MASRIVDLVMYKLMALSMWLEVIRAMQGRQSNDETPHRVKWQIYIHEPSFLIDFFVQARHTSRMKTIVVKITQYIDVEVPDDLQGQNLEWEAINDLVNTADWRKNCDFVIDEVDGEKNHRLVDENVGV